MNDYEGSLIVVEGIDGSGTSTLSENLKEELGTEDYCFTKEPSEGVYGRLMRKELQADDDPTLSDFFLFMADRYDHVHSLIGPKLEEGTNVITDRYSLSTWAYQTPIIEEQAGFGDLFPPGEYINMVSSRWVIEPDLTLYIDIPASVSIARKSGEDTEKYENFERLRGVRKRYQSLVEERDYAVEINGDQSEKEVLEESLQHISQL